MKHTPIPPRAKSVSVFSSSDMVTQRKPSCACGGGCPRCKEELNLQPKLSIGQPYDKYEQEAHRVAWQVMTIFL